MNNRDCLTRDAGLALAESFYRSGLKQKDFCKTNGIAYHILQYWKKIHSKLSAESIEKAKFMPIKLTSVNAIGIKLVVNAGLIIEVNYDTDLGLLKKVIEVCRACG